MFFNKKLNEDEIESLRSKAEHLGEFCTNVFSVRNRLEQKLSVIDPSEVIVYKTFKQEKAELECYIKDRLKPLIRKANKFLLKYGLEEVSYREDEMFKNEDIPELMMIRYYLSMDNIKSPIFYLTIFSIKGFEFSKGLYQLKIRAQGVKLHVLSYYYVSDSEEKNKLNKMYNQIESKYFYRKIEEMYSSYVLEKICGVSFLKKGSGRAKHMSFNYNLNNFKEVLDRIKYNVDNVVSIR